MRAFKLLGLILAGLVALAAVAVIAVLLLVDPNSYKDRIAKAVKSATGRELAIAGDTKLSVFPQLALTLGRASLGNPPGFGDAPFARLERVSVRVRLLPLLHKQLEVGRIEIDGLDLALVKNAAGKGNWEDFGQSQEPSRPQETADRSAGSGLKSLDLAGVTITNSRVSYGDLAVDKLNVDIGHLAAGLAVPVKLALDLRSGKDAAPLHVAGSFDVTPDLDAKRYRFAKLALDGTLQPPGTTTPLAWRFATPLLDLDLTAQTLAQTPFSAQLGSAQLAGNLAGSKLLDAPALQGDLQLQPLAPRELMTQLGVTPPATRDPKTLARLALKTRFAYGGSQARAEDLDVQLDDTRLRGRLGLDLDSGAKTFDLDVDHIDVDHYLPPPTTADKEKKAPVELPTATLKPLRAKGTLAIGQATVAGVKLGALQVGLDADGGVTHLAPVRAQLYGGQYTGDITIDSRAAAPALKMNQTMAGIDVAQLLNDFAKTKRLSGKGTVTTALTAQGGNGDALMKSLRGTVQTSLTNGAVEGVDLWYGIAQAQSLLQKRTLAGGTNTRRTAFDTFKASADIVDGIATTKDLLITSQQLRVTGQGSTNLVNETLDYQVTATILKAPPQADEGLASLTLAAIPVNITGSFDDPKVRPDLAGMAKARLQQEVDKRKDAIKEKVQEKLQDKLKGLFGR